MLFIFRVHELRLWGFLLKFLGSVSFLWGVANWLLKYFLGLGFGMEREFEDLGIGIRIIIFIFSLF